MSHKSALQAIAALQEVKFESDWHAFNECQRIAREELTVTSTRRDGSGINGKADRKMAKDRKRAETLDDPERLRGIYRRNEGRS